MTDLDSIERKLAEEESVETDDGEEAGGFDPHATAEVPPEEADEEVIESLLPDRASINSSGNLAVRTISTIGSDTATLTETRKEIIKYTREHPLKTPGGIARALGGSESYVRYTHQDFAFLLANDYLYEYFIEGEVEESTEEEEEEPTMAEDPETEQQEAPVQTEDHAVEQEGSSEGYTIELDNDAEAWSMIVGLVEAERHDMAWYVWQQTR